MNDLKLYNKVVCNKSVNFICINNTKNYVILNQIGLLSRLSHRHNNAFNLVQSRS